MRLIIFFMAFFLVLSCGSVKKNKSSLDIESSSNEDINSSTNTNRWINSDNFVLEPVDLSKPMLINKNGKTDTVWNTRVINNKTIIKEQIKDTTSSKTQTLDDISINDKNKETDNTKLIIGVVGLSLLFLLFIILIAFYFISKKINSQTKLIHDIRTKTKLFES